MKCPLLRPLLLAGLALVAAPGCQLLPSRLGAGQSGQADYNTKLNMARLLESQGQVEKAANLYHELAETHPKNAEPFHQWAVLDSKQGKNDAAGEHFRQALKLAPKDAELLNDYGYWLYLNNKLDESEKLLTQAVRENPEHKMALNNLAVVVGRRGRYEESLNLFRKIGGDAEAHTNLGYLYAQGGKYDQARKHYQKALEIDSTLKAAAEALVQLPQRSADPAVQPAAGGRAVSEK